MRTTRKNAKFSRNAGTIKEMITTTSANDVKLKM